MTDSILDLHINDGLTDEEIDHEKNTYGPLAEDVRELILLALQTRVDADDVARAREHLAAAREILERDRETGPYGTRYNDSGRYRTWGNAVMGLRNAIAPIGEIHEEPDGRVWADFRLNPAYEGPAGHTHGGVTALVLDQILGDAARAGGHPGMTGTLTVRYRRRTPLGALHAEARIDRVEGRKTFVKGHIADAEGVCVEAEGIFIAPQWMIEHRENLDTSPRRE
ncbi:PaaI family thioesterase [Rhodococcus sp. Z13]|uniref:PaaI family thioesterase n=1 Tax=Rhodococcus sacchari TaxID=2962047 RepID=A0ACD4DER7_9NOCA|nr:PaaI family thioesterase [Rhodococcus sp. Z13]UYP18487.1 PaaI family thioesterase [Rhodococcus sp. Z13]